MVWRSAALALSGILVTRQGLRPCPPESVSIPFQETSWWFSECVLRWRGPIQGHLANLKDLLPMRASLMVQLVKNPPAMQETWIGKIPWRMENLATPVFWPGEFHGLYSSWGHKESDTTEWPSFHSLPSEHSFVIQLPSPGMAESGGIYCL